jgi:SAM-dependent methyltransferase
MPKVPLNRSRKLTRRAFLPIVAAGATLTGASDDEAVWALYLVWLDGRVLGDLVGLETYRKVLADEGLPKEDVDRRIALIYERSLKRPEAMRLWFNSMYGPHGAAGPDWPTPFLMDVVKNLTPGSALDVCMGEGRNSIFLAGLGWKVTGFDVSDVAIANVLAKAKKGPSGDNSNPVRIPGLRLRPREMGPDRDDVRVFPDPRQDICRSAHCVDAARGIARVSVRSAQDGCRQNRRRSVARNSRARRTEGHFSKTTHSTVSGSGRTIGLAGWRGWPQRPIRQDACQETLISSLIRSAACHMLPETQTPALLTQRPQRDVWSAYWTLGSCGPRAGPTSCLCVIRPKPPRRLDTVIPGHRPSHSHGA